MVPIFLKLSSIGIWFLQGVCSTCGEEPWNVPQTWQHVYLPVVAKVTKSLDGLWYGSHRTGETGQEQTEPNTTEKQEQSGETQQCKQSVQHLLFTDNLQQKF